MVPFWRRPKRLSLMIPLVYFLVIVLTVSCSSVILHRIVWHSAQTKINEAALQTVSSIETNVRLLVDNVNNYSKMIVSDANLQRLLRLGDLYADIDTQSRVGRDLHNLIQTFPNIDSVFVFDRSGNWFSVGSLQPPAFAETRVERASWYGEAVRRQGKYLLRLNGDGAFADDRGGNFVSFIRLIRDIDDTSPLGVLAINIPESAFAEAYSMDGSGGRLFAILDERHRPITANAAEERHAVVLDDLTAHFADMVEPVSDTDSSGFFSMAYDGREYTVSWKVNGETGWTFLSVTPNQTLNEEQSTLVLFALVLLAVNGIVFYVSSIIISRNVLNPINQLLTAMDSAGNETFVKMDTAPNNEEFRRLFAGYNRMIDQIRQLLKRTIDEQNMLRKAELNMLQAQIKPHFLYNTLDSISSLAMSGLNDQVCDMLEALGNYYRLSVSKGREVITVGEEIEMVRNYLHIQKVRYRDLFEVEYDIDEHCLQVPILKLVLQPLAENALYHGIRNMGDKGTIKISARRRDGWLQLAVSDDGVGMPPEKIRQVLESGGNGKADGFGLKGTMERLRIHYNGTNEFRIDSEPGKGTTVTILIPAGEDGAWKR